MPRWGGGGISLRTCKKPTELRQNTPHILGGWGGAQVVVRVKPTGTRWLGSIVECYTASRVACYHFSVLADPHLLYSLLIELDKGIVLES